VRIIEELRESGANFSPGSLLPGILYSHICQAAGREITSLLFTYALPGKPYTNLAVINMVSEALSLECIFSETVLLTFVAAETGVCVALPSTGYTRYSILTFLTFRNKLT
jgi:hypothetical protein